MGKNKKGRGNGRSTPKRAGSSGAQPPRSGFIRATESSAPGASSATKSFTLRDAAKRSEFISHSEWTPQSDLRHKPMAFVKSSDVLDNESDHESPDERRGPVSEGNRKQATTDTPLPEPGHDLGPVQPAPQTPQLATRQSSPAPSNSSEEVVFTGRGNAPKLKASTSRNAVPDHASESHRREHNVTDSRGYQPSAVRKNTEEQTISSLMGQAKLNGVTKGAETDRAETDTAAPTVRESLYRKPTKHDLQDDYISNMRDNGVLDQVEASKHTLSGAEVLELIQKERDGWERHDLEDLADLSTSDEVHDEISAILDKREHSGQAQYLIVWAGCTPDDARWIRRSALDMEGAEEAILAFEHEEQQIAQYHARFAESSTDDGQDDDRAHNASADDSDDDDWEDEEEEDDEATGPNNLEEGLSDDVIARLLSKQEEMGMGGDELLIHDGDYDELDEDGETYKHDGLRQPSSRAPRSRRERKSKWRAGPGPDYEEDELFGTRDQIKNFDVMDWERPSLGGRPKGFPDIDMSDSELEQELRATWTADRQKKKAKKAEREELRVQRLLGKSQKPQNLAARYGNGLSLAELRVELADFLDSNRQTLDLPPLDKKERKVIHEIAAIFNCKSKSNGSGRNRYPVLTKTRRTIEFNDDLYDRMERKLGRRILGGIGGKSKPARPGRSGRGTNGAIHYREGETVGAGAAEIGSDNRGRAMLEKMGWSKGTALGAMNNKGIMMPIEHIVKTSRAGLG